MKHSFHWARARAWGNNLGNKKRERFGETMPDTKLRISQELDILQGNILYEILLLNQERSQDSWPPEKNSAWGLIAQSFCVIKLY